MNKNLVFNRVLGLKFLYDYFPYYFPSSRLNLFFVNSKDALLNLKVDDKNFDTLVLKRSGNNKNAFLSDIKCKDNRFFSSLTELKKGIDEFSDEFDFCVECHTFKKGENYYSDRLAIAQFSTENLSDTVDRISFIPSIVPGVNTRDNEPYLMIEFPYNSENIFHITKINKNSLINNKLSEYDISYLTQKIHKMISTIRDVLLQLDCHNNFQLIIRIDSYLNLLPIDFRTPQAWTNKI